LVIKSHSEKVDLVRPDYYEAELAHQSTMEATTRANELSAPVAVQLSQKAIAICLPPECTKEDINGEIYMYRPSDSNLDKKYPLLIQGEGCCSIPSGDFQKGLYVIKISWWMAGKNYYHEEALYLE